MANWLERQFLAEIAEARRLRARYAKARRPVSKLERLMRMGQAPASYEIECNGDVIVRNMKECLQTLRWKPTDEQMEFIMACIAGCLPLIYGDDWEAHQDRVLKEWKLTKLRRRIMMLAARRVGKTVAMSFVIVLLVLFVQGLKIAVFSTGGRISSKMMGIVLSLMPAWCTDRIIGQTKEELHIAAYPIAGGRNSEEARRLKDHPSTSVFMSYPNNPIGKNLYTHTALMMRVRERVSLFNHVAVHRHDRQKRNAIQQSLLNERTRSCGPRHRTGENRVAAVWRL